MNLFLVYILSGELIFAKSHRIKTKTLANNNIGRFYYSRNSNCGCCM